MPVHTELKIMHCALSDIDTILSTVASMEMVNHPVDPSFLMQSGACLYMVVETI